MPSTRSSAVIVAGSLLLMALFAPVSYAAAPHPSEGSATVDGSIADWSLSGDFFADMTGGGADGLPVRAKLYLKYDCESETLSALVLVQGDEKARRDRSDEAYIRIDGSGELISSTHGDFAWVNPDGEAADGFEGAGSLAPGSHTIRAHVLVADDSADGYTPMDVIGRTVPLEIECGEVAPTQGTPTPKPATPTPAPTSGQATPTPTGEVAPTTGSNTHRPTLPPTDASDPFGPTSGQDGVRLVAVLLGAAVGTCLLFTPRRRRIPVERPIEEPTEEDTEQK